MSGQTTQINKIVNSKYTLMKGIADESQVTSKLDYEKGTGYLSPPVNPNLTKYILENSSKVDACCDVLSKDLTLNSYLFTPLYDETDVSKLENFWNKYNKHQLSLAIYEVKSYGYGCLEVIMDQKTGEPVKIEQFPARTACIQKTTNSKGETVYYAVQRKEQGADVKLRLYNMLNTYDEKDKELPICFWIGGDNENQFYSTPKWFKESDNLLGKINLDILNANNLNNGNQIGGIITFFGPPQRPDPETGEKPEQTLRKQVTNAGTGNILVYLESQSKEFPLDVDYIKISNDNWDYLMNYAETIDKNTLSCYRVPKTRLMINDESESMNSHKSDSIWEIYTITLNDEQLPYEIVIQEFNKILFKIDAEVEMDTPMFTDKRQVEHTNTLQLFNTGLLTMEQAIQRTQQLLPDVDFESIDMKNPLLKERFFNGNPLGLATNNSNTYDEIISWLKGAELE